MTACEQTSSDFCLRVRIEDRLTDFDKQPVRLIEGESRCLRLRLPEILHFLLNQGSSQAFCGNSQSEWMLPDRLPPSAAAAASSSVRWPAAQQKTPRALMDTLLNNQ